ncbi:hypothetical protein FPQ18DRAFT_304060 [Pyronema domesticum]|nr:hypothetical protein FPQ18DRAFT_311449 [Pyronema domesticum]KAI5794691.1 hypothetical protein FPQ18DRAFT_304060 [Pyronema domesticum]
MTMLDSQTPPPPSAATSPEPARPANNNNSVPSQKPSADQEAAEWEELGQEEKEKEEEEEEVSCDTCIRNHEICDKGMPECFNCLRDGVPCEGYMVTIVVTISRRQL